MLNGCRGLSFPASANINQLKLCDMTKQEMRIEFFRVKECLRNALLSRDLGYIGDENFYKEIQNIWTKMNDLTPKFK